MIGDTMRNYIIYFFLCCFIVAGALILWIYLEIGKPNAKIFLKDDMMIFGTIKSDNIDYIWVRIGSQDMPMTQCPDVYVQLNQEMVPMQAVTQSMLDKISRPDQISAVSYGNRDYKKYSFVGALFTFCEETPIEFYLTKATLWDSSKSKSYTFPLSQKDVIELFGEPDKQIDKFVH